jgi:hypothetical protein
MWACIQKLPWINEDTGDATVVVLVTKKLDGERCVVDITAMCDCQVMRPIGKPGRREYDLVILCPRLTG